MDCLPNVIILGDFYISCVLKVSVNCKQTAVLETTGNNLVAPNYNTR